VLGRAEEIDVDGRLVVVDGGHRESLAAGDVLYLR
jgi:hypothetical protein